MTEPEGRALLDAAGVQLTDAEMDQLLDRTEGWPVGLYLAALALKAGGSQEHAGVPFTGDDRLMADYLRTELLDRLSEAEVSFLTQTSVLGRMSGDLCDAVLDRTGSGAVLESLAQSNLLLVVLDRHGEWYRYHHLFRDLLRAELQRREPALVTPLHARAAGWYEANRMPELAIDHAQRGGDVDRVNRLMLLNGQPAFAAGRRETVRRWLVWFDEEGLVEQYPAVAVLGTLFYINTGDAAAAERWAIATENPSPAPLRDGSTGESHASPERILPDGSTLASWRAVLRAFQCRDGIEAMRRDVESGFDGMSAGGAMRCAALVLRAHSFLIVADADRADPIFAEAVEVGLGTGAGPALAIALAERGYCALGRGDWPAVDSFVEEARSAVQQFGLGDYTESALAYTLAARAAMQRGDGDRARDEVARAARLRPLLTYVRPTYSVRTLLELARAYLSLDDAAGAGGRTAGPLHLGEAARSGRASRRDRPGRVETRDDAHGKRRRVVAHRRGTSARAVPADPPDVSAGRRAAPPFTKHGEVPGDLDLSEAGGLLARRSDRAAARGRAARHLERFGCHRSFMPLGCCRCVSQMFGWVQPSARRHRGGQRGRPTAPAR